MKKVFLLMACVAMLFVGCEKDESKDNNNNKTDAESGATVNLRDNQASMNGEAIDVVASVAYQINASDENRYFVDAINGEKNVSIRFDLYESIVGQTINLANLQSVNTDISIMVECDGIYLNQEIHPGDANTDPYIGYSCNINNQQINNEGSMFKSGTLRVARTAEAGFILVCSGVLFNDIEIALRVVVPESEIDVWNSSK